MSRLHVTNEYVLELNNVYHAGQVIKIAIFDLFLLIVGCVVLF